MQEGHRHGMELKSWERIPAGPNLCLTLEIQVRKFYLSITERNESNIIQGKCFTYDPAFESLSMPQHGYGFAIKFEQETFWERGKEENV